MTVFVAGKVAMKMEPLSSYIVLYAFPELYSVIFHKTLILRPLWEFKTSNKQCRTWLIL